MERKRIAIIGGGPAGMMAADVLAPFHDVHVYEHGKAIGRKFLVAGQGGFNLTNSAEGAAVKAVYTPPGFLDDALDAFGTTELRTWLEEVGIGTYIGTSGRVFPTKGIKPIEVLERIRERLLARGVQFHLEHAFDGFDEQGRPIIENSTERAILEADFVLFALGGASWPVTGSTGIWPPLFTAIGINDAPFRSSNCGIEITWPEHVVRDHGGKPLKNIRITAGAMSVLGEANITEHGLEGNAVYPVVPALREALEKGMPAHVEIDFKPNNSEEQLLLKLTDKAVKDFAYSVNIERAQLALLKAFTPKERFLSPAGFVHDIKHLRLPVAGLRPVGEAISTVGGIRTEDLGPDFAFKKFPHLFAIGEMVDWDAPTGGFLLQGCFAMGHHAAQSILRATRHSEPPVSNG
ncbi:MAG: TIGR03862 family flavoprotein [Flavobacteriales bacterium]|nr:TIGR03862 family flavoprotein [Flavobacteriales bacterium]